MLRAVLCLDGRRMKTNIDDIIRRATLSAAMRGQRLLLCASRDDALR